jgi:hypothetical protein
MRSKAVVALLALLVALALLADVGSLPAAHASAQQAVAFRPADGVGDSPVMP